MSILETRSIGAGGGSIARVNDRSATGRGRARERRLDARPGRYNQGGTEPTVTDADVVLGYINPDRYFGGKMRLKRELAREGDARRALRRRSASRSKKPRSCIRRIVDANMADVIARETVLKRLRSRRTSSCSRSAEPGRRIAAATAARSA